MGDSIQHREEEAESRERPDWRQAAKRGDMETGNVQPTPDRMMF